MTHLEFARREKDLRLKDVAEHSAVAATRPRLRADAVGEIERGVRLPTPAQARALAIALDVPAHLLLRDVVPADSDTHNVPELAVAP